VRRRGSALVIVLGFILVVAILGQMALSHWLSATARLTETQRVEQEREWARGGVYLSLNAPDGRVERPAGWGTLRIRVNGPEIESTFSAPGRIPRRVLARREGGRIVRWIE
jgi:type II secretory pathway component PulK